MALRQSRRSSPDDRRWCERGSQGLLSVDGEGRTATKRSNARTRRVQVVLAALLIVSLTACAPGSDAFSSSDRAGFFLGIWHGWIAPVTLIWQIFNSEIRIYEPLNTGFFYDLGFYIAIISGFGSIRLSRKKTKTKKTKKSKTKGD